MRSARWIHHHTSLLRKDIWCLWNVTAWLPAKVLWFVNSKRAEQLLVFLSILLTSWVLTFPGVPRRDLVAMRKDSPGPFCGSLLQRYSFYYRPQWNKHNKRVKEWIINDHFWYWLLQHTVDKIKAHLSFTLEVKHICDCMAAQQQITQLKMTIRVVWSPDQSRQLGLLYKSELSGTA